MKTTTIVLSLALAVAACGSKSPGGGVDAPPVDIDAAIDSPPMMAVCNGGEHFAITGAMSLDIASAGVVSSASKVIGVMGAPTPSSVYILNVRNIATDNLDTMGDHDIGVQNLKFIQKETGADCSTPGTCMGFFATSGTYTVTAVHPRYQAHFAISGLYDHSDNTNTPGPAMAGMVTGCVDASNP